MRNEYIVSAYEQSHALYFIVNETSEQLQIQPTGQVIVDSDQAAFLYLVEENNAYSHIRFPKAIWPQLVAVVQYGKDPYLRNGTEDLQLHNFADELEGLLFNIEGNSNYGDEFVAAVEAIFAEIFEGNEV
ncbi:MAG: hypothetical protein ABS949_00250 [Solibacillus sp.]